MLSGLMLYTIEFVVTRPGVRIIHSETCDVPRLIDARDRADQRLEQLRRDNPGSQFDGYRILDAAGNTQLSSWVT